MYKKIIEKTTTIIIKKLTPTIIINVLKMYGYNLTDEIV